MNTAKVNNIDMNKKDRQIIVTIDAKGSNFIKEPNGLGFPYLVNGAPLVEGINLILKHGHNAVQAIKGNTAFQEIVKENERLKQLLRNIRNFDNGDKVTVGGLTYQKGINENSFDKVIQDLV